jgi:hypothetical protein
MPYPSIDTPPANGGDVAETPARRPAHHVDNGPRIFKLAYTIKEAMAATGFSRTRIYREIAEGHLDAKKAGKRTFIMGESLARRLQSLPPAEIGKAAKLAALETDNER